MTSIVQHPWQFACQWYEVEDIHRCIQRQSPPAFEGSVDPPKDVSSREFAEWLTEQYRLAMTKGAQIATNELRDGIESVLGRPGIWITRDEREGWNLARREVERFLDGNGQANNEGKE